MQFINISTTENVKRDFVDATVMLPGIAGLPPFRGRLKQTAAETTVAGENLVGRAEAVGGYLTGSLRPECQHRNARWCPTPVDSSPVVRIEPWQDARVTSVRG